MVLQESGIPRKTSFRTLARAQCLAWQVWHTAGALAVALAQRQRRQPAAGIQRGVLMGIVACVLAGGVCLGGGTLALAQTPACEDTLARFLTQLYFERSYCTCAALHREVVKERGHVSRRLGYTLPGLSVRQLGSLPDLSRVQARFWGMIVNGPGGVYNLSVRFYAEGHEAEAQVRQIKQAQQGQEFEITAGPKDRIPLRANVPYQVHVEGENPALQPEQVLTLQGRACVYLMSG
jgi:hypothetical protein